MPPIPLTPATLPGRLAEPDFAARVRAWIPEKALERGEMRAEGLDHAWAIDRATAANVRVVSDDGTLALPLKKLDRSLWAGGRPIPHGSGYRWWFEVDGKREGEPRELEAYLPNPDMVRRPGVPQGTLTSRGEFRSAVFAGTAREWWVYVPKQYDGKSPANIMFWCDGQWSRGSATVALDNLHAKGEIPTTIAVFVTPGRKDGTERKDDWSNRWYEYDRVSDEYARMLHDELLPILEKEFVLKDDPEARALVGASSGGICAFKSAFLHPEWFRKVISFIGSYVNLYAGESGVEGGHNVAAMVRRADRKPLRVFLQDGENDLDNMFGNWPLANRTMANSLAYRGYDHWFVMGRGFHNGKHGDNLLPDALRWIWRK